MNVELEFEKLQNRIADELKQFIGQPQDGFLENKAQQCVDYLFRRLKARSKLLEISHIGLRITGCKLGFDIGTIGVKHWRTEFIDDPFGTSSMEPSLIALGYVNGCQLYIICPQNEYPRLVVRSGRHPTAYSAWTPMIQGLPDAKSLHYVALERAKTLGYLSLLRTENDD